MSITHGTDGAYTYHRCRCAWCRAAHAEAQHSIRRARYAQRVTVDGRLVHPDVKHGRAHSYRNWGCRCVPCTEALRLEQWDRRARMAASI